jgi:hypothetical protein
MKQLKFLLPMLGLIIIGFSSCKKANVMAPSKPIKIWNRAEVAIEVRSGVELTLVFDETTLEFRGMMVNKNATATATNARVEVHTFDPNGVAMFEYGPSTPTDILAGDSLLVVLPAQSAGNFTTFSMHSEIGTTAGTGG